jgi:predicted O-methyltransferase YrrM
MSNLFFILEHDINSKIEYKKSSIDLNTTQMEEFNNYIIKSKLIQNSFVRKIIKLKEIEIDDTIYLFKIFNISLKNSVFIRADHIDGKLNFYIEHFNHNKIEKMCNINNKTEYPKRYDSIIQNKLSNQMYEQIKQKKYCDRQSFILEYTIKYISYFFDILEADGCVYISIFNICEDMTIEIVYLLSCMFKKIVIYEGDVLFCDEFLLHNSTITKNDVLKCIDKKHFTLNPKNNLSQLLNYLYEMYKYKNNICKLIIDKKYDEYIDISVLNMYNALITMKTDKSIIEFFYKRIINNMKRVYLNKKIIKVHSIIKEEEGKYIDKILKHNNLKKCLEVGMAFGISAFYILSNKNTNLISIDPFQSTQWGNNGKKLLKEFGFNKRHKCIERKSYEVLPELLKKRGEASFDFIFIDGWHTFDYTLVDFFYANLLLEINGFIVIDDVLHAGVKSCISYLNSNYKFYKKIDSPITVACYQKIRNDDREWNFHNKFF